MAQGADASALQDGSAEAWDADKDSAAICEPGCDARGAGSDDRSGAAEVACGARADGEPDSCTDDMQGQVVGAAAVWDGGLGAALGSGRRVAGGGVQALDAAAGHAGFREYYRIVGGDESAEADDGEPGKEGELRTKYESSHSLFGMLWQVAQATGWSVDYILWGLNWETLVLMLADAPRYMKVEKGAERGVGGRPTQVKGKRTAQEILECFQTRLKK